MTPVRGLNRQLVTFLKNNFDWHTKGLLTADMEWRHDRGQSYGRRYIPETVGRALRHLEERKIIAVKDAGKSVEYKFLPLNLRPFYIPYSHRPDDNKGELWNAEGRRYFAQKKQQKDSSQSLATETQSEKCNRLLGSFRPEFGNTTHIYIRDQADELQTQRNLKRVNKKRVDELEKRIIRAVEFL